MRLIVPIETDRESSVQFGDDDFACRSDFTFAVSRLSASVSVFGSFGHLGIRDRERCGEGVALIRVKGFCCAIRARSHRRSAGHQLLCADDVALPLRVRRSNMQFGTLCS